MVIHILIHMEIKFGIDMKVVLFVLVVEIYGGNIPIRNDYQNQTHELARLQVEAWLKAKERVIADSNEFRFHHEFVKKHKLGTRIKT